MAAGKGAAILRHIDNLVTAQKSRQISDRDLLRRFTKAGDEAAFAAILRRHGAMVLRVCQRMLLDLQDAEDAFQATFLVLLRRAKNMRWRDSVAGWLHEVAYRVSLQMRNERMRRRAHETRVAGRFSEDATADISVREAQTILHEELHRLPERLQAPLVLCYLESATQDEAAGHLGWSLRTLKRRLERGRALLHARLTRRGLTLSAVLSTSLLGSGAASASLTQATLMSAISLGAGRTAGALSPAVSAAVNATLRGMLLAKLRVTGLLVLVVLLGTGLTLGGSRAQTNLLPDQEHQAIKNPAGEKRLPTGAAPAADRQGTDRYGDPLPQDALSRMGTVRLRHHRSVEGVAFSPDGKILASAGWDEAIRLWDPGTGKPIRALANPRREGAYAIAFSPDGTKLVSVGEEGSIRLWDVGTGKMITEKKGHRGRVYGIAFSPDGGRFASAGENVCVWDVATGAEVFNFKSLGSVSDGQGVAFSPDGKLLAASFGRKIQLWNSKNGAPTLLIPKAHGDYVISVAFRDSNTLISGGYQYVEDKTEQGKPILRRVGQVRIWDAANGKQLGELAAKGGDDAGCSAALSANGKLIAGAFRQKIRIWDAGSGQLVRTLDDYRNTYGLRTHVLAFSPDAKLLAAGAGDLVVRLWDVATGKRLLDFSEGHRDRIDAIGYSPDGPRVLTGGHDGSVRLWDAHSAKQLQVYPFGSGLVSGVTAAVVSPDGKTVAAGGYDDVGSGLTGFWKTWELTSGKELRALKVPDRVQALAFSPDGIALAVATGTHQMERLRVKAAGKGAHLDAIHLWDVATGTKRGSLPGHEGFHGWLAFSHDGKSLASLGEGKEVRVWTLATRKQAAQFAVPGRGSRGAAFSADGKIVVTSVLFGDVLSIWDLATGQELRSIRVANSEGSILALSPDGRILASGSIGLSNTAQELDYGIHLWEMATGGEVLSFQPDTTTASLAFSPDGRMLVSGMDNGTALTWNVKPPPRVKTLSPKELERLWSDLAGAYAATAYASVCALAALPEASVPFLKKHLPPAPEIKKAHADGLIAELGSDKFAVRQRAYTDLEKLAEKATPFLKQALADNPPLEVRRRLESLLALARVVRSPETLRRLRAIQVLEDIGSPEARQILTGLSGGFPAARETQDARASLTHLEKRRQPGR